jgi:phosphoglycolate phosphatase-like HAD superfamily hydrolase
MATKNTLVLFDIDGTLLRGGGAGERALTGALREIHGIDDDMRAIEMAGRTDSGIVRQIFSKHGIEPTTGNISRFCDAYLHHLALLLPQCGGRLLPGIIPLLDALRARPDIAVALLTGNLARGAELKLSHFGVWHYFEFGAYADDHHDRNQLGPFARARAKERHGVEFPPERIFVLGDTPHDIACARAVGARAVAVATGNHTREQLAQCAPDFLLADLGDLVAVMRIFDGE